MKIDIMTLGEQNLRIHTLTGDFNFDYLFQSVVDIYNDQNFDPQFSSIWDLTHVKNVHDISREELEKIVAYVTWKRSKLGKIRTAIIVSEEVDFGVARMYEQEMEATNQAEINVFHNIDTAIEWLKS